VRELTVVHEGAGYRASWQHSTLDIDLHSILASRHLHDEASLGIGYRTCNHLAIGFAHLYRDASHRRGV
jgi:hypothetical protein